MKDVKDDIIKDLEENYRWKKQLNNLKLTLMPTTKTHNQFRN